MHEFPPTPRRSTGTPLFLLALGAGLVLSACGGGGTGTSGGQSGIVGELQPKPGGGEFFVDPNGSGGSSRLKLTEIFWGRLVDVYAVDAMGDPNPEPTYTDFLIEPTLLTDGINYTLQTSPVTQQTNLIIAHLEDSPEFEMLVRASFDNLPVVNPQNTNGTTAGPFTQVPRNAALSLRFDDCLEDGAAAEAALPSTVKVLTGYAPSTPFDSRLRFDPNFGALVGATFHSTRVLVDTTVTEQEAMGIPNPPPINGLGLPASITTTQQPNVAIRIPTEVSLIAGQFEVLTNLRGNELTFDQNGPNDSLTPTFDVVRGFRSGNQLDPNNGFLLDVLPPEVLGSWPISVSNVLDVGGVPGFDFDITLNFPTVCQSAPEAGDVLTVNGFFLEVIADGGPPDGSGDVLNLLVSSAAEVPMPSAIQGGGLFLSPFDPMLAVDGACWLNFIPPPQVFPSGGVSPTAQISVRFSEPMDPDSIAPLDDFTVVRGTSPGPDVEPAPAEIVVGSVNPTSNLLGYTFAPALALSHTNTVADPYHVRISGAQDLAGNVLVNALPDLAFTLDPVAQDVNNGSVALRFSAPDELGVVDLGGQAFYDLSRGVLLPRPVSFTNWPADRTMAPAMGQPAIAGGVRDPLTPFGSRLQTVWRYIDVGWDVTDVTKYNLDVIGLNWAPFGGQVIADFYEQFEMLLAHSFFLPDETAGMTAPSNPSSGLVGGPDLFDSNFLVDPDSPRKVVHNRAQGYTVNPADLFVANTGTLMMPFPMNRTPGIPALTFTWRDTGVLGVAAPGGGGIPQPIEAGLQILPPMVGVGSIASQGNVPTIGLPLLLEVKCFPSNSGVGLNSLDANTNVAFPGFTTPNFRAWSSGGVDTGGGQVNRNPDLETVPRGGFNPLSVPPGAPTSVSADFTYYLGQIDVVTLVSRAFTAWIDTGIAMPDFRPTTQLPPTQPTGTSVRLAYRGATGFTGSGGAELDASSFDAYGNLQTGAETFLDGVGGWSSDVNAADGAQHLQIRITFINNLESGLNAELAALGILFEQL